MKKSSTLLLISILLASYAFAGGGACDCWIQRDSTWQVAEFTGSGGSGGPGIPPLYQNDDWSTDTINLPFTFCFYGQNITQIFINNNGNISIGAPYSTFTALSFPDPTYVMIAPFWSDVDTRGPLSGVVYYKIYSNALAVQWDHVGYYNAHDDLLNTYQLIITDGNSHLLPEQKNVGFCYRDMQYTTGDASGGINGVGGTPATVGVNPGNGINYLQIGLYDNASLTYDGPYGNNDGVASLSNQSFAFNVCIQNLNVPPILSGDYICDTIQLCVGDTFIYNASFLSPEQGQNTTVSIDDHGAGNAILLTSPGNPATVFVSMIVNTAGHETVDIIGLDDGSPAVATTYSLQFNIQNCTTGIEESVYSRQEVFPNPVTDKLYLNLSDVSQNIRVTDYSGRLIYQSQSSGNSSVNTENWPKGIYFVNISSASETRRYRIIKN